MSSIVVLSSGVLVSILFLVLLIDLMNFSFFKCRKRDLRLSTGNISTPGTRDACSAFWAGTNTDLILWFLATSAVTIADRIGRRLPSRASSPAKIAPSMSF